MLYGQIEPWPSNQILGNLLKVWNITEELSGSVARTRYRGTDIIGELSKVGKDFTYIYASLVNPVLNEFRGSIEKIQNTVNSIYGQSAVRRDDIGSVNGYIPYLIPKVIEGSIDSIRNSGKKVGGFTAYHREAYGPAIYGFMSLSDDNIINGSVASTNNKINWITGQTAHEHSEEVSLGGLISKGSIRYLYGSIAERNEEPIKVGAWIPSMDLTPILGYTEKVGVDNKYLLGNILLEANTSTSLYGIAAIRRETETSVYGRSYLGDERFLHGSILTTLNDSISVLGISAVGRDAQNSIESSVLANYMNPISMSGSILETYRSLPVTVSGGTYFQYDNTISVQAQLAAVDSVSLGAWTVRFSSVSILGHITHYNKTTVEASIMDSGRDARSLLGNILGTINTFSSILGHITHYSITPLLGVAARYVQLTEIPFGSSVDPATGIQPAPFVLGSVAQAKDTSISIGYHYGHWSEVHAWLLPRPINTIQGYISNKEITGNLVLGAVQTDNRTSANLTGYVIYDESDPSNWPEITNFSLAISVPQEGFTSEASLGGFIQPVFTQPKYVVNGVNLTTDSSTKRQVSKVLGELVLIGSSEASVLGHIVKNPENTINGYIKGASGFKIKLTESEVQ